MHKTSVKNEQKMKKLFLCEKRTKTRFCSFSPTILGNGRILPGSFYRGNLNSDFYSPQKLNSFLG
jgi:hypothetical protein